MADNGTLSNGRIYSPRESICCIGPNALLVRRLLVHRCMAIDPSAFNDITGAILASAIEVHRTLGPGLLESAYCECLRFELTARNIRYAWQRTVPIVYKGTTLNVRYQVDLVVEGLVVVEVKSVAAILPVHLGQTLTYMQLTECPVGLLINFNVPRLMDGVKRLLNPRADFPESRSGTVGTKDHVR